MKKVLLFGYYGYQNTGDEAILKTIVQQLKGAMADISLKVLTYKADETEKKYKVKAVSRNRFMDLIRAIKECDVVISGGGSILQDITSSRSLLYYLAIIWLAKKLGKKVMFYGNGFGPITKVYNKKLVKYIINQVDVITVRDFQSKETMKALGIHRDIRVTADVTFAMEPLTQEVGKNILQEEGLQEGRKTIGISVRPWRGMEKYKQIIAKTADYLQQLNYQVIFIPMQYPHDQRISLEITDLMKNKAVVLSKHYGPEEILSIIGQLDLLIGMRLHSLVFAAIAKVPMVGIEYDEKIKSFLELVNQKSGGKAEFLDEVTLWSTIEGVLKQDKKHREQLEKITSELNKKANQTKEIFIDFMSRGE